MTENEEKSELALAIEQRKRKLYPFDVKGFFGLAGKEISKLRIRVLMKAEDNASIVAAHHLAKKLAAGDDATRSDADLLDDLKLKEAIQRSCFLERETKQGKPIQAFPGGEWMEKNFSTDEIAILWNLMQEVKKAESPMLYDIDRDEVMALAEGCAKTAETDLPEHLLATANRAFLTTAFVLLACDWWKLKQQQEVVNVVLQSEDDKRRDGDGDEGESGVRQPAGDDASDGDSGG